MVKILGIVAVLISSSCANELRDDSNSKKNELSQILAREGESDEPCEFFNNAIQSSVISGVSAVNIDNGIPTECANNILVFPTLQSYEDAIDTFDNLIDQHNDDFDQITAGMSDEEADDYADEIGFDEDEPLTKFENELEFCSLRKYILELENNWLQQQGNGSWNLDTDPSNYFIDDATEQALLSYGSEFIVGNCKDGYTMYKVFDWGYVSFPINSISETSQILIALNNLANITIEPLNINGASIAAVEEVLGSLVLDIQPQVVETNPSVVNNNTNPSQNYSCNRYSKEKGEFLFSSNKRIQWKHKLKDVAWPYQAMNLTKIKTITESYRKKNGHWKKYRATISAGYDGGIVDYYTCTNNGGTLSGDKQKKRKRLKKKYNTLQFGVKVNEFFSIHSQEGNYYQDDIFQY